MRLKIIYGLLLSSMVTVMLMVTGCSKDNSSYQSLLQSPRLTSENEAIRLALKTILPDEYQMVSAKMDSGEAIKYADVDGDGKKEVVFFYSSGSYSPYVECVVMKKNTGTWKRIIQKTCDGYDINKIIFGDMNGDGKEEMAVLWSDRYAEEREEYNLMELFSFEGNSLKSIFQTKCSDIAMDDINKDSRKELFVFRFDNKSMHSSMSVYTASANMKIHQYAPEVPLQQSAYFYNFVFGSAGHGKNALFLDGGIGAHSGITEIIVDEGGRLKRLYIRPSKEYGDIRVKPYSTNSKDFDSDGVMEVSQLKPLPGYENSSMAATQWLTEWFKWDGASGLIFSGMTYENYDGGYSLRLPGTWRNQLFIRMIGKKGTSGSIELQKLADRKTLYKLYILTLKGDYDAQVAALKKNEPEAVEIVRHLNKVVFAVIPENTNYNGVSVTPEFLKKELSFSLE